MDGVGHYRKAEELLTEVETLPLTDETVTVLALQALGHATLANAAAAALGSSREWIEAAGSKLSGA